MSSSRPSLNTLLVRSALEALAGDVLLVDERLRVADATPQARVRLGLGELFPGRPLAEVGYAESSRGSPGDRNPPAAALRACSSARTQALPSKRLVTEPSSNTSRTARAIIGAMDSSVRVSKRRSDGMGSVFVTTTSEMREFLSRSTAGPRTYPHPGSARPGVGGGRDLAL